MIGVSFNDGWEFRELVNPFMELSGVTSPFEPVTLPHDAMLRAGRGSDSLMAGGVAFFHTGTYEYRKRFTAPETWRGCRASLRFEGVYRSAAVFLNGEFLAQRPYGYAEFTVPLDEVLRYGEDNILRVEARTHDDARWYSGGGVYRNTTLFVGGAVHVGVDGVRITTPDIDDDRAVVEVDTTVVNARDERRTLDVVTEIVDAGGDVVAHDRAPLTVAPSSPQTTRQRLYVRRPARWSIDDPNLYRCQTRLLDGGEVLDEDLTTFGIRTLQVDPEHGLRINGEHVDLRGACIHHDNGVLGAATITRADERRVELLKAAGFNAIRSAHNPISRALLDACDRFGMVVMDEAFDMWTQSKGYHGYSNDFPTWWAQDIDAMVVKDFNHPSVVLYSIGNEIFDVGNSSGARRSREMAQRIRALDDTRFVTNGVNAMLALLPELVSTITAAPAGGAEETGDDDLGINTAMTLFQEQLPSLMRSDLVTTKLAESFAALDVAGYNYLDARYEMDADLFPNRVIVGSETGITTFTDNWRLVQSLGHVIGDFCWTGWDYLGEVGIGRIERQGDTSKLPEFMAPYPWLTAWCGDIDITGHRRPVSYFRETVFGLRHEPYLAVQRGRGTITHAGPWSFGDAEPSWTWPGREGEQVTVEVYSDTDEVELLLNGDTLGRVATGDAHGFKAELDVTYAPGELVAVAYRDGKETGRTSLRTAGDDVQLAVAVDRSEIMADHHDLAYVTIELLDDAGTAQPEADRTVAVAVQGPAVLQGLGSANPTTEATFLADSHDTYRGRALAVIRPTGAGRIVVTVRADGCEARTVELLAVTP